MAEQAQGAIQGEPQDPHVGQSVGVVRRGEDLPQTGPLATWRRWRQRWWVRWAVDLAVFGALFAGVMAFQTRDLVGSGEAAPAFRLKDMQGQAHALSDYQGKKTVVAFWAPWCSVCKVEVPTLSAMHADMGDDVNVISIVQGYRSLESVEGFVAEHGVTYPVLLGTEQTEADYRISKYPTIYILDEQGRIEDTVVGYTTGLGLRARVWF